MKKIWIIIILIVVVGLALTLGDKSEEVAMVAEAKTYTVTINNLSEGQVLSPGAYVVHTSEASLNYLGELSPAALEPLAEYGSNADYVEYLKGLGGVLEVVSVDAPVLPGQSASFDVTTQADGLLLSGIMMAVGSNDGFALLDAVVLDGTTKTIQAVNYDNGSEENNDLLTGFEGGQPDPSQGPLNVENGTATDPQVPVVLHDQLTDPVMEITIALQG